MAERSVWRISTQGDEAVRLDDRNIIYAVRVSPDGKSLASIKLIRSGDQEELSLAVSPAEGGNPTWTHPWPQGQYSSTLGWLLEWTRDGKALSYVVNTGAIGNVWLQPLDQSPPRQITDFDEMRIYDHACSLDGRTLYVVRGKSVSDAVLITNFH